MPAVDAIALVLVVAAATALAALWHLTRRLLRDGRHHRLTRHAQQVLITPPAQVDPHGAAAFWANLHGLLTPARWRRILHGAPHVAVEYRWTGRQLQILLWVPGTVPAAPIAAAARAAWPGAATTITPATDPLTPPPGHRLRVDGGALVLARPDAYPLATDHDADPCRALLGAATGLQGSEQAAVQVLTRPASPRHYARLRAAATALATGRATPSGLPERLAALVAGVLTGLLTTTRATTRAGTTPRTVDGRRDPDTREALAKSAAPLWEVAVRYAVAAHPGRDTPTPRTPSRPLRDRIRRREPDIIARRLTTLAHAISAAFAVYTGPNRLRPLHLARPDRVLAERRLTRGFLLSTGELAVLAGLPTDLAVPGLDRARAKPRPPRSLSRPAAATPRSSAAPRSAATPSPYPSPTPATTCTSSAPPAPASPPCSPTSSSATSERGAPSSSSTPKATSPSTSSTGSRTTPSSGSSSSTPTSPPAAPPSTPSRNAPAPTTTSSSTTSSRSSPRSSNATGDPASTTSCASPA